MRSRSRVESRARALSRAIGWRLTRFGAEAPAGWSPQDVPDIDVALYFSDTPDRLYQLRQWLPVFERSTSLRAGVVVRQPSAYTALAGRTRLPVLLAQAYDEMMSLYDAVDFSAVVYVNNGFANFQSLAYQRAVHVHVNHGESDKISMVSNQAKAYDRVFVAGEAAVQRHLAALAWFDQSRLVRVGRPQLDLDVAVPFPPSAGPTITYAPTWEGADEANNYTSLVRYGAQVIDAALAVDGSRVVYKPHPQIPMSRDPQMQAAHRVVMTRIEAAQREAPARGHATLLGADILGVLRGTDLLVTDVSSVGIDYLYLRPDRPLVVCDRRSDREALLAESPAAGCAHVVDRDTVAMLVDDLRRELADDPHAEERHRMRQFYFDGIEPGHSTERFFAELAAAVDEHRDAVERLQRRRR